MKMDVFDTYAQVKAGQVLHFDVLVPVATAKEKVMIYAGLFLTSIGCPEAHVASVRCNFCHSEMAAAHVSDTIKKDGYFILQMEGCPNPY